jgi:pimeloyl-ACP methyl ester carboxylesterase
MQPPDQYFEHGDVRLRLRDEGDGAAVVFLHGWTLDLDSWQPQAAELSQSFRVIRIDRRGFGLSSGRPSITADVTDLRALLDHLELPAAAVIGMSQGARVALDFAIHHPQRVTAIVLDGAPNIALPADGEDEIPIAHYRELVKAEGLDAFRKQWQEHPFTRLHTRDAETRGLLTRILMRYPGHDLGRSPEASEHVDAALLCSVRHPTLIVNGELDTDNRKEIGEALSRELPLAERAVIANAGHLANLDNPRAYNDLVRRFLIRQARIAA